MSKYLLFLLLAVVGVAEAHKPALQECVEFSQFIGNVARSRDYGFTLEHFVDKTNEDITLVRGFPPEVRWFIMDESDEVFLMKQGTDVYATEKTPEQHEANALKACLKRIKQYDTK